MRRRSWWLDAVAVSVACLFLQGIEVGYGARFFGHLWTDDVAMLVHPHVGLILGVAMLGGDRRVLSVVFLIMYGSWLAQAGLSGGAQLAQAIMVAAGMFLLLRWTRHSAHWAGGPCNGRRRLHVKGMWRYVWVSLLLFPLGWAAVSVLMQLAQVQPLAAVASIGMQQFIAVHMGVGALTLPFLLLWTDESLRHARLRRWGVVTLWLAIGVLVGAELEAIKALPIENLVTLVYDYRMLVGALLGIVILLLRVEISMPLLSLVQLMHLHALKTRAQDAESVAGMFGLSLQLLEINFMALMLAMLFMLNRERKRRYRHVRKMGRQDATTGLANAHALQEAWRALQRAPDAVGFLLLDRMERVLGSYGWRAQAALLRETSRLTTPDVRMFHLGGGQFVLLPSADTNAQTGDALWSGVLKRLRGHAFRWNDAELYMSPYLGLVKPASLGSAALNECITNACEAALQARRQGEHAALHYDFGTVGQPAAAERRHRLSEASEALACIQAGRVELFVQPIVRIDGGAAEDDFQGEVLCRLRTRDNRLLMPGEFIVGLEDAGHATELDIVVIETLFRWLRDHPASLARVSRLGINLSGRSVASASFRSRFVDLLQDAPVPLETLCFELTETAVIASQAPALRLFEELRARGCRLALDDFGSGVQNFERLKQVPVDSLKIDGQFVRNMENDPSDLEIVRASVAVAKAHGLITVAEYVESASLVVRLRELGVDWGQGFHLGRPRPIEQVLVAS